MRTQRIWTIRNIILSILFLLGIPMILLAVDLFSTSLQAVEDTAYSSTEAEAVYYANMLDQEIKNIFYQQHALLSNNSTIRLNTLYGHTEKSTEALLVQQTYDNLVARMTLSDLTHQITLYMPSNMHKLSVADYFQSLSAEEMRSVLEQYKSDRTLYAGQNGISVIARYPILSSGMSTTPSMLLICELSSDRIISRMKEYASLTNATAFVLYSNDKVFYMDSRYDSLSRSVISEMSLINHAAPFRFSISDHNTKQIVTGTPIGDTGLVLLQITPQNKVVSRLNSYRSKLPLFIACASVLLWAMAYLLTQNIYKPIAMLTSALKKTESGDFSTSLGKTRIVEFQAIFTQFDKMTESLQSHIQRENEFHSLASEAEIRQLQYQISPHFLYNTYFILRGLLVQEEYSQAAELSSLMGRYLKYIVHVDSPYVLLKEEINHASSYAEIQRMRFANRISIQFDECPPALDNLKVPRLILQPLIENAFMHGVKNMTEGGIIEIHFHEENSLCDIIVEDNGNELDDEKLLELMHALQNARSSVYSGGIAILNIHRRLTLMYGDRCGLYVERSHLGGLRCTIRVAERK